MQFGKNRGDTKNAIVSSPQPRNRLGEGRSENDIVPTYMWKRKEIGREKGNKENRKEWRWGSTEEVGTQKVLEVKESIWKEGVRKDASIKDLGSHYRVEEGIYAKKGKSIFAIKERERGSTGICRRLIKKRVYLTLQVTPDITSTFCG